MRSLLPILLIAACQAGPEAEEDAEVADASRAAPVEVIQARLGPISEGLEGTATVEARVRASIRARASGAISRLEVEEGDRVEAGKVLARIDQPAYVGLLDKARASKEKAARDLKEAEEQHGRGLLPRRTVDDARFQLRSARLEIARLDGERALGRVRAPVAGVIVARHVQRGEAVAMGAPLFDVADLSVLEAHLRLPERHLGRLRTGQRVEVSAQGLGEVPVQGQVERIAPTVDPRSGTVKVTVGLGAGKVAGGQLRPGMYVRARVIVDTRKEAVLVPKRAILYEDERAYAFRVRQGVANKLLLRLGYSDRSTVQVQAPLAAGDTLIIFGHRGLEDGARVRVVEPPADPAKDAGPSAARGTDEGTKTQ